MNGPRICCSGCGVITDDFRTPLCPRCADLLGMKPSAAAVLRAASEHLQGPPVFGRDYRLGFSAEELKALLEDEGL